MYPVLFTIASVEIRSYPVFLVLGILFGLWAAVYEGKRLGLTNYQIITVAWGVVPFAYMMAILNGWLFSFRFYTFIQESRLQLSTSFISFGVILGALLAGKFFAKQLKLPLSQVLDPVVLAIPVVFGVLRIGCLLNGCCYGLETDSFLGMFLPGDYGIWANRFPTQIMLSIFDLGLFAWLWFHRTRKPFDSSLVLSFLIIFSIGRLLIDSLRDLPYMWGQISPYHLTSVIILVGSAYFYFKKTKVQLGINS